MIRKILCWLGFHKTELESITVYKTRNTETGNNRWCCKHCDYKTEWEGFTSFGTIRVEVTK